MAHIRINQNTCKGCELCLLNCPKGCLRLSHGLNGMGCHYAIVEASRCNGCGRCFLICPDLCIEIDKPAAGGQP